MMKRIAALCLILTLCLSLSACGKRISEEEAISIALAEAESWSNLELTEDMAVCDKVFGGYRVTFLTAGMGSPVTITVVAKTGEITQHSSRK